MVVAAHGGHDKIDAISSTMVGGMTTIMTPQGNLPIGFSELAQYPYFVSGELNIMGRSITNITGPNGGWITGQDGTLGDKTEEQLADERLDRDRDMVNILRGGESYLYRAVYLGSETVDGHKLEMLALVDGADKPLCHLKVNADNFQIYAETYDGMTLLGEGFIEDIYSDYKDVNGVLMPMKSIKQLNGDQISETNYTTFEINPPVPAGAFDKPI
jgi:hypothetical protein